MGKNWDLTGVRFGLLTVIKYDGVVTSKGGHKARKWICKCDCGKEISAYSNNLKPGKSKSCGCVHRFSESGVKKIHGMSKDPTYNTWSSMKSRCGNRNIPGYDNYGGRGITVCRRWEESFDNFLHDMGERPEGKSLDRIDNSKGYDKENCRWAGIKTQARNKRNNVVIEYNGVSATLPEWSEILGIPYHALYSRVRRNWSVSDLLTKPIRKRK